MNRLTTALLLSNCILLGWIAFRIETLIPVRSPVSALQAAAPELEPKDDDLKRGAWRSGVDLLKEKYGSELCKGCGYDLHGPASDDYNAANIRMLANSHFLMGFTYQGVDSYGNRAIRLVSGEIFKKDGKWSLVRSNNEVVR
jgi:hypothetical protein